MCSRRFSPVDDLRLVDCVKGFPALYKHEKGFKNPDILKEHWRIVAEVTGRDEESCKRRWRDIRDHYFKVKKKQQARSDQKWMTRWTLYHSLSFLDNAKRKTRHAEEETFDQDMMDDTSIDIYEPEMTFKVEEDSQEPQTEFVHIASPKRDPDTSFVGPKDSESASVHCLEDRSSWNPRNTVAAFGRQEEDDIDVFMRSVALTIKKLEPKKRAEAKLKILSLVTDLEFPRAGNVDN